MHFGHANHMLIIWVWYLKSLVTVRKYYATFNPPQNPKSIKKNMLRHMSTPLSKYIYIGVFLICQTLLAYLFSYQIMYPCTVNWIKNHSSFFFSHLLKSTLDCGQGLCNNVNRWKPIFAHLENLKNMENETDRSFVYIFFCFYFDKQVKLVLFEFLLFVHKCG